MGIFNRFVNVLRANTNAALDKAEDPELMLTQMISDLETQKREAKQRMTEALALQKRFERQTEQEEAEAQKWEDKAVLAVQKGKDDLAKDHWQKVANLNPDIVICSKFAFNSASVDHIAWFDNHNFAFIFSTWLMLNTFWNDIHLSCIKFYCPVTKFDVHTSFYHDKHFIGM